MATETKLSNSLDCFLIAVLMAKHTNANTLTYINDTALLLD
jgi:hypothetical protein